MMTEQEREQMYETKKAEKLSELESFIAIESAKFPAWHPYHDKAIKLVNYLRNVAKGIPARRLASDNRSMDKVARELLAGYR